MKETIKSRFKIFGFKLLKVLGITSLFTSFGMLISCDIFEPDISEPPVAMYGAPVPEYSISSYNTSISTADAFIQNNSALMPDDIIPDVDKNQIDVYTNNKEQ
jgi:hypothetical protein